MSKEPQTQQRKPTQKRQQRQILLLFLAATVLWGVFERWQVDIQASPLAKAQSANDLKKTEAQVRAEMLSISNQLGLTCIDCHNTNNFASDEKRLFKVAAEHIKITEILKERGFDGKRGPEASCYMCHRGEIKPPYLDPKAEKK